MTELTEHIEEREENSININEIIHFIRIRWYCFAISLGVCCGIALFYIMKTPKTYTRTATVLIKDDQKGGGIGEFAAFEDLGLLSGKTNINNELVVFKAAPLMREVVQRLHLDVSYKMKKRMRPIELYTQSPVLVSFKDIEDTQSLSFKIEPISSTQIKLSDFKAGDNLEVEIEDMLINLSDTIYTPVGKMVVTPTLYYIEECYSSKITISKNPLEDVTNSFLKRLDAALTDKQTTIINLTLSDVSIMRADDVLNTLIAVYQEDWLKDKNQIAVNISNFINERLIVIEEELGDVDSKIERYKSENLITDPRLSSSMYLTESNEMSNKLLELENQVSLSEYLYDYIQDPENRMSLIPSNSGLADLNVENQIKEFNTLLLKRNRLIENSSERNPLVIDLNNSLTAIRQGILQTINNLFITLDLQIQSIQQREQQATRRIASIPDQERNMLSKERQQKIKESLYLYLLQKREENELNVSMTAKNIRLISSAMGSKYPTGPKGKMIFIGAFVMGLFLPLGVFWLLNELNTKVKSKKDVTDKISAPFLGEIPLAVKKSSQKDPNLSVAIKSDGRDIVSEAFRVVRTNMAFMETKDNPNKVIMITSFNPSSGKSFISVNLGVSFALTGKKVILLDMDLRKGTTSALLSKGNNMGISGYLSGLTDDISSIIIKQENNSNLSFIPVGIIPPNPAELLLNNRLDKLIDELKKEYDYIFLDCTPVEIVADATITTRISDLTLFVIREGLFEKRFLPDVQRLYTNKKFKNMAVLLNGSNLRSSYYGYGYGYGYGYDKSSHFN